ncbi:MAG: adenylosuccinate lyase, partial [Bacteroidetes bacterium]
MLNAISPVDGRYAAKTSELSEFFSEYALIRYRVLVEIAYFKKLVALPLPQLKDFPKEKLEALDAIVEKFSLADAERIKTIERTTNHDVKAVEYFLKEEFDKLQLSKFKEFIHFGLTSQDINNTATPLMLKEAIEKVFNPLFEKVLSAIHDKAQSWKEVPMLARTHGQPASPTRLGKEFAVFEERLKEQHRQLSAIDHKGKFGGATGNFNAHLVAYPQFNWKKFADELLSELGLVRSQLTTQIEHYDNLAAIFHALSRINTILIDLCRDIWTYISMDYFKQKVIKGEVGSSA